MENLFRPSKSPGNADEDRIFEELFLGMTEVLEPREMKDFFEKVEGDPKLMGAFLALLRLVVATVQAGKASGRNAGIALGRTIREHFSDAGMARFMARAASASPAETIDDLLKLQNKAIEAGMLDEGGTLGGKPLAEILGIPGILPRKEDFVDE